MKGESIAEGSLINPQSLRVAGAERVKDALWNGKIKDLYYVVCLNKCMQL